MGRKVVLVVAGIDRREGDAILCILDGLVDVQRNDTDGAHPGADEAPEAAPAPAMGDQDIEKLTEKVWQRIRRMLQLERERRRGLP